MLLRWRGKEFDMATDESSTCVTDKHVLKQHIYSYFISTNYININLIMRA